MFILIHKQIEEIIGAVNVAFIYLYKVSCPVIPIGLAPEIAGIEPAFYCELGESDVSNIGNWETGGGTVAEKNRAIGGGVRERRPYRAPDGAGGEQTAICAIPALA
jgi:hypothetical protein